MCYVQGLKKFNVVMIFVSLKDVHSLKQTWKRPQLEHIYYRYSIYTLKPQYSSQHTDK